MLIVLISFSLTMLIKVLILNITLQTGLLYHRLILFDDLVDFIIVTSHSLFLFMNVRMIICIGDEVVSIPRLKSDAS